MLEKKNGRLVWFCSVESTSSQCLLMVLPHRLNFRIYEIILFVKLFIKNYLFNFRMGKSLYFGKFMRLEKNFWVRKKFRIVKNFGVKKLGLEKILRLEKILGLGKNFGLTNFGVK